MWGLNDVLSHSIAYGIGEEEERAKAEREKKASSNWHKGTPTEEGLYVVFNEHLCYDIVEVKPWTTLHGVVAYQKIEPLGGLDGHTD